MVEGLLASRREFQFSCFGACAINGSRASHVKHYELLLFLALPPVYGIVSYLENFMVFMVHRCGRISHKISYLS